MWVNANAFLLLGMASYVQLKPQAETVARRLVHALADDLRNSGTWHECMSSASGKGLAAPGFLSWNTLGAQLLQNVQNGVDPFRIL